ncbi:MAG: OmpA family protein [Myxococcota bacterium]
MYLFGVFGLLLLAPALATAAECMTIKRSCEDPVEYMSEAADCVCYTCSAGTSSSWTQCTMNDVLRKALLSKSLSRLKMHFAKDSFELRDDLNSTDVQKLKVIAPYLASGPPLTIEIEGRAGLDEVGGTDAAREGLAVRRADSVKKYLLDLGIPPSRLTETGWGEFSPQGKSQPIVVFKVEPGPDSPLNPPRSPPTDR